MADNGGGDTTPSSARSRFLAKSKWGKVFRERDGTEDEAAQTESGRATAATNTFALNDDVAAFLRPSTDRAAALRPKLDVSIAPRWPGAHEVRAASASRDSPAVVDNGFVKPRRREGLTVSFARSAPEIIGEGGDEMLEPTLEVGRRRAIMRRALSERRPSVQDPSQSGDGFLVRRSADDRTEEDSFHAPVLRRAQTSHNELSPPVQRKQLVSSREGPLDTTSDTQRLDARVFVGRESGPTLLHSDSQASLRLPPDNIRGEVGSRQAAWTAISDGPVRRASPSRQETDERSRHMRQSEGMAFRRASAMILPSEDHNGDSPDHSAGVQPAPQLYDQLSHPDAPVPGSDSLTLTERYTSLHSRVTASQPPSARALPSQQVSAQMIPQVQPTLPRLQPPEIRDHFDSTTLAQPSDTAAMSRQQDVMSSQNIASHTYRPHETSRQPLQDTEIESGAALRGPRPYQTRPSGSSTSINQLSSTSGMRHSPGLDSPPISQFAAVSLHSSDSKRDSRQSLSPQDHSPRSSMLGLSSQPSPNDNAAIPYGQSKQANRLSASNIMYSQHERPDSSASARSVQNFSFPRTEFTQPARQTGGVPQQDYRMSPSGGTPTAHPRPPNDYFPASHSPASQHSRSRASSFRPDDPRGTSPANLGSRSAVSPLPPTEGNPAADAAYADFAARVAHMKGVFRLTAERQQPADRCTPHLWLRVGLWWYVRGKMGVEELLQQQRRSGDGQLRELLLQPHVDLAKVWWILSDPLEAYDVVGRAPSPESSHATSADVALRQAVAVLSSYMRSLCLAMGRSQLHPPQQSLIQGQDTTIWLSYPVFRPDVTAMLEAAAAQDLPGSDSSSPQVPSLLEAIPLSDTRSTFRYAYLAVWASIKRDGADLDQAVLSCLLTITRSRTTYQTSVVIASQSELVSLRVRSREHGFRGLTWQDVSWKQGSFAMILHLPRGLDVTVRMQESDFRLLWDSLDHSSAVERAIRPETDEMLVYQARLAELQYADSSGSTKFPQDKLRNCMAMVFARRGGVPGANHSGGMYRPHRLLVVTDPGDKSLSFASHDVGQKSPLMYDFLTDSAANGMVAMVVRLREPQRQIKILLVLSDIAARQGLHDVLTGRSIGSDEEIVGKMALRTMGVEPVSRVEKLPAVTQAALANLEWQRLAVISTKPADFDGRTSVNAQPANTRLVARHATGCVTDWLPSSNGERLIRLPTSGAPVIQLLRAAHENELGISIDARSTPAATADGLAALMRITQMQPTIHTLTFATPADLHGFQAALTGFSVRYDGVASTLAVSRRRTVVSLHRRAAAAQVRLQVVVGRGGALVKLVAFMDDFAHADALCFQIKSTDVYELVKGNGRDKKPAVKLVDAKFSLPPALEKAEEDDGAPGAAEQRARRRFVQVDAHGNAEEHDDVLVGFETDEDRDQFARALPAEATLPRGLTLKRRI